MCAFTKYGLLQRFDYVLYNIILIRLIGTSVCNGDSGGGMVFVRNHRWYLRGIVSLTVAKDGLRVCDTRHYVVFTDVAKYSDFITKNLQ